MTYPLYVEEEQERERETEEETREKERQRGIRGERKRLQSQNLASCCYQLKSLLHSGNYAVAITIAPYVRFPCGRAARVTTRRIIIITRGPRGVTGRDGQSNYSTDRIGPSSRSLSFSLAPGARRGKTGVPSDRNYLRFPRRS